MAALSPLTNTLAGVDSLRERAIASSALAVDTEFMRERTYRAELCLLQLAGADWLTCVDPFEIDATSLGWLQEKWRQANCELVLHAARQDLEVLAPLLGKPARIFDTQIAAALCGLPAQVGYAELVRQLLGVELAKAQTRTDWSKRPLSAAQLDYALDDVRYLLPLRAALLTKIAALGRSPWLEEELRSLTDPALLEVDPDSAWQRLRGLADFDEHRLRLAQRLAAWRERRAITRNRPRGWILEDAVLREMIQQAPRDLDGLRSIPLMPPGVVERAGAELLQVIAECALPASLPPLPKRSRPDPAFETKVRELSRIVKDKAQELALAPELLATRRDLERLARTALAGAAPNAATAATPLRGWRGAVVGAQLLAAL